MRISIEILAGLMLIMVLTIFSGEANTAIIANHNAAAEFGSIPSVYIEEINAGYHIYYVHTSHGSQIITGINMLEYENSVYEPPYISEHGDDLGHNGDTTWVPATRGYLDNHPQCNMAMFSWCGGCSDNSEEGISIYLNKMNELEQDYPGVIFIYMTGHLDGTGPSGNLYARNNQIRAYCSANNKILFDFADIESYDPDGIYYPDETDACNWCDIWCASHSCPDCGSCAHSHCFNCYLKGKAWWWMMARITGWGNGEPICGDADGNEIVDLLDVSYIIAFLYSGGPAPDPLELADVNGDTTVNILDITFLIAYLYQGGPAPNCP